MGMESYYFTISFDGSTPEKIKDFFQRNYIVKPYSMPTGKLFRHRIIDENRFVIDNKAVIGINSVKDRINVTFELCFSNYSNNVAYAFGVAKKLCLLGSSSYLVLPHSQYSFDLLDISEFKRVLEQSHKEKLRLFNQTYGEVKTDILPQDFYDYIRKLKRRI